MGRLGLLATTVALFFVATSAEAQVTNVTGEGENAFTIPGGTFPIPLSDGVLTFGATGGSSFQAVVDIGGEFISFENGNAVTGPFITTKSSSVVDITFLNSGSSAVTPVFNSTIIPAGLGFYLADRTDGCGGNLYQGCPESQAGYTFSDLTNIAGTQPTAFAGFEFSVVAGGETLYTLNGSMQMVWDPALQQMVVTDTLDAARSALAGFTLATPDGSGSAIGYAWDPTNILLDFKTPMAAGESRTLSYITTVTSYTRANCIDSATCLVAYSGFGDPVGRGGGVAGFARSVSALAEDGGIDNVVFEPSVFRRPTFENGVLTFKLASAIPEPATWTTMIVGFGVMGAAVRMRRRSALLA